MANVRPALRRAGIVAQNLISMKKYLIGKLKALRQYIVRRSYSLWYGVKFESGYSYKMIKHTNLDLLERHHYILLDMGWEKFTDVDAGFSSAWCWYRMKL